MPGFDVSRLVYDVVNIIPEDISPAELLKLVRNLNKELNTSAINRNEKLKEYYGLIKGKDIKDRKYFSDEELKSKMIVKNSTFGTVTPQ